MNTLTLPFNSLTYSFRCAALAAALAAPAAAAAAGVAPPVASRRRTLHRNKCSTTTTTSTSSSNNTVPRRSLSLMSAENSCQAAASRLHCERHNPSHAFVHVCAVGVGVGVRPFCSSSAAMRMRSRAVCETDVEDEFASDAEDVYDMPIQLSKSYQHLSSANNRSNQSIPRSNSTHTDDSMADAARLGSSLSASASASSSSSPSCAYSLLSSSSCKTAAQHTPTHPHPSPFQTFSAVPTSTLTLTPTPTSTATPTPTPTPTATPTVSSSVTASSSAADDWWSAYNDPNSRVHLKPSELVRELDRFIIGQSEAKRAVAIALRNRWRRHHLSSEEREEILPKNILMIGPTGSGKTEIARRLAKLTDSPFLKVEATKFTEVGFHGKDVDTIIHDLLRVAIANTRAKLRDRLREKINAEVEEKILNALVPPHVATRDRQAFRELLRNKQLESTIVTIEVDVKEESASMAGSLSDRSSRSRHAQYDNGVVDDRRWSGAGSSASSNSSASRRKEFKSLPISEMRSLLQEVHIDECMSDQELIKAAIRAVEEDGIVFLDEIDKICASHERPGHNADASDEGVQRDLLPLLEGTTITTKQGDVNTDHILFIASGAFHAVKPSDLLAELQGRLPVRVELKALTEDDLYRILTVTENNLLKQQQELMQVDGVTLTFTDSAVREIARVAHQINGTIENIGARRLHTVVERIVENISFQAPDMPAGTKINIDETHVRSKVSDLLKMQDLSKFIF